MTSTEPPPARIDPRRVLVFLCVAGAILRFATIGRQSYWYDESVSGQLAATPIGDILSGRVKDLGNPPLHPVLLHLWSLVFGAGDASLRCFSATAGVFAIPLLYSVGKRLVGPTAALVATAFLAFAPAHVYFAQEARVYTLVTTLCLLSLDMFLRGVENPRRTWVWVVHSLATFLSIYAHYYAVFIALAELLWLLWAKRHDRALLGRFLASSAVAALVFSTWLPAFYGQITFKDNLRRAADTWYLHLLSTPMVFGVGTTLVWKDTATTLRLVCAGLGTIAFAAAAVAGGFALRKANRPALVLLSLWLLLPVAIPLAVSILLFPFYYVRYGLLASPAYYLLVAAGLVYVARPARVALAAVMGAMVSMSFFFYYTTEFKHDFRDATRFVETNGRIGDVVLFDADIGETPYSRYARAPLPRLRLVPPIPGIPQERFYGTTPALGLISDITATVQEHERVWFVASDPKIGSGRHYRELLDGGWGFVSEQRYHGVEVRLYERR